MVSHSTRLFVLAMLARHGDSHGHAIRLMARQDHTDRWTEVKVGSLYGSLRQLALDGLVEVARTERAGHRPPRTVYAITPSGRAELERLRTKAMAAAHLGPDPADLAVALSSGLPADQLAAGVRQRIQCLQAERLGWVQLEEKARPHLSTAEAAVFSHYRLRYEAELKWHQQLLLSIPRIAAADSRGTAGPPQGGTRRSAGREGPV